MNILEKILRDKRAEVKESRRRRPLEEVQASARKAPPARSLRKALLPGLPGKDLRIIAEVKKASPSRGVIREDFDAVNIARAYASAGAAAISVLTDEKYFQGRLEFLEAIRREVDVPLLRKDFVIDAYQVWEARAAGADAVLLILAAIPDDETIVGFAREAEGLGMEVLWEVHDAEELSRVSAFEPAIVGINNRNLRTFEVSLETTRDLLPSISSEVLVVSESGFFHRPELEMMRGWGVAGFLIGESLLRQPDPGVALGSLLQASGSVKPHGAG